MEVRVEDETVWLNRQQIAQLFDRDVKTIGKHINNALREELQGISTIANFATVEMKGIKEIVENPVVAKFATTASDGKIYQVEYYSLDVILSVGYRVKSQRGIQFRIWANRVLKEYLLKGYAINHRIERVEKFAIETEHRITETQIKLDFLKQYINEDTRMQLELINQTLAKLQFGNKLMNKTRNPIGFKMMEKT